MRNTVNSRKIFLPLAAFLVGSCVVWLSQGLPARAGESEALERSTVLAGTALIDRLQYAVKVERGAQSGNSASVALGWLLPTVREAACAARYGVAMFGGSAVCAKPAAALVIKLMLQWQKLDAGQAQGLLEHWTGRSIMLKMQLRQANAPLAA